MKYKQMEMKRKQPQKVEEVIFKLKEINKKCSFGLLKYHARIERNVEVKTNNFCHLSHLAVEEFALELVENTLFHSFVIFQTLQIEYSSSTREQSTKKINE
jgi:ATP sulfurylase